MSTSTPTAPSQVSQSTQEQLRSLVGANNLRVAGPNDSVAGVQPQLLIEPANEVELAAVLRCANDAAIAVIPRGGGTKLAWGNPPLRGELILSTARLHRVLDHPWGDLTVSVEAGCTFQALQDTVAQHGQRLALDPLWPERATIGGILSANDSGALRLRFGALRDLIIGITLALPDGTLASSGGRVVKNVAGYDLPKLATAALGTLGIITRAVFRLHPICPNALTLSFSAPSIEDMQDKLHAIQSSKLAHSSFQIRCAGQSSPTADLLFEATEAGLISQRAQVQQLVGPIADAAPQVWRSRQELWNSSGPQDFAIIKLSVLPSDIAKTIRRVQKASLTAELNCSAVFQVTGLGLVRLDGNVSALQKVISEARSALESDGGSLVVLHRPHQINSLDAWGTPGDALPLMRSLKHRLDPRNTLNPGRYVGGI